MCCAASRMTISSNVANKVDPIADAEVVETELMLSDLESLEKRDLPRRRQNAAPPATRKPRRWRACWVRLLELLREGKPARLTVPGG